MRGAATAFSILNTVFAGHDTRPDFDSPFINYVWGFGGLGATKRNDGASVVGSPYTASTRNIPAELQERRYPVLWRRARTNLKLHRLLRTGKQVLSVELRRRRSAVDLLE